MEIASVGRDVARFGTGPAEFGARALGNRSIIADPREYDVINHINKLVKMHDFWMPFAPSILEERAQDYLVNPKQIDAKFMAIGFDTTLAHKHLNAGLHPFDKSLDHRLFAQRTISNTTALLKAFERLSGVGAV